MALKSEKDENPFEPPIDEDFLKTALEYRDNFEDEEEFQEALAIWPRCPRCGRRRVARCPVCKTSGTLFPLGDRDFWDFRSDAERERDAETFDADERRNRACGRRACSCSSPCEEDSEPSLLDGELIPGAKDWRRSSRRGPTSDVFDELPDKRRRRRAWARLERPRGADANDESANGDDAAAERSETTDPTETPELVVCFVCSEAFVPKFPRRCEWCDYDFGDGEDPESVEDAETSADVAAFVARKEAQNALGPEDSASPTRLFWTIAAFAIGAAAFCGYFAFLLR